MQTIKIQNRTEYKDKFFKVIVNGKKHVIHHQFLNIDVADDKPFKIKAKYFWNSSPEYTFGPKEKISLQILMNRRIKKWNWIGAPVGAFSGVMIGRLLENSPFCALSIFLILTLAFAILCKRNYTIKEVNADESKT